MLTDTQIKNMLEMQGAMNAKVNPQWLTADYPFLRAIVVEGGEAMDHAGWKWWKAQTRDTAQLQIELVDIWHFFVSEVLKFAHGNVEHATVLLRDELSSPSGYVEFDGSRYVLDHFDEVARYELLIGLSVSRRFSTELFATLMADAGMDWADLYRQYVGKNTLNIFRQQYGYKLGTYHKIWGGMEDNVHLTEIMLALDASAPDFKDKVYEQLVVRYSLVLQEAATGAPA